MTSQPTWVEGAAGSSYDVDNLPYGVITSGSGGTARVGADAVLLECTREVTLAGVALKDQQLGTALDGHEAHAYVVAEVDVGGCAKGGAVAVKAGVF